MSITRTERVQFAGEKVWGALKWMALSGTATFFLIALLDVVASIDLPNTVTLLIYLVINTALFGIGKYVEGEK